MAKLKETGHKLKGFPLELRFDNANFRDAQLKRNIRVTPSMLADPSIADLSILLVVGTMHYNLTQGNIDKVINEARLKYFKVMPRLVDMVADALNADEEPDQDGEDQDGDASSDDQDQDGDASPLA